MVKSLSNLETPAARKPASVTPAFAAELGALVQRLRSGLSTQARDYRWRIEQLRALKRMLLENDTRINDAMWNDLRKSPFECLATEQGVVLSEIETTLKNLAKWMKPRCAATPLYNFPGRCSVFHEPLGLTLIIGAWNYPINLLLSPLVGAIAGGNAAILKPSEISVHTANLIAELIPRYLDPSLMGVVQGGAEETSVLLEQTFDHIFFTGSGNVGKIVLSKAAAHLTPVTLELGGKSPAVVLADCDLKVAARRIAWGKFMNAGQTCVAPDYVLIQPSVRDEFIAHLKDSLHEFYGPDPLQSQDYCRIVNTRNFDRLYGLMTGLKVLHGGTLDRDWLYISPTLVQASLDVPIMQEEIFGPILPILEIESPEKMMAVIQNRPKPLSLYLFTEDQQVVHQFLEKTSSGALVVNDVVIHMPVPSLPFGGVGASGMGNYHGEFSFRTFTHAKGVLQKTHFLDLSFRYPPHTPSRARWLRWLFK